MYLVACHLSNDALLNSLEPIYLERTRKTLADELGNPNLPLIQWMQASCLLTYYLTRVGRYLEARHEVSLCSALVLRVQKEPLTSASLRVPLFRQHSSLVSRS